MPVILKLIVGFSYRVAGVDTNPFYPIEGNYFHKWEGQWRITLLHTPTHPPSLGNILLIMQGLLAPTQRSRCSTPHLSIPCCEQTLVCVWQLLCPLGSRLKMLAAQWSLMERLHAAAANDADATACFSKMASNSLYSSTLTSNPKISTHIYVGMLGTIENHASCMTHTCPDQQPMTHHLPLPPYMW